MKYTVEISKEGLKLKSDDGKEFSLPADYLRALYLSLFQFRDLKEGETKVVELLPKDKLPQPKPSAPERIARAIAAIVGRRGK